MPMLLLDRAARQRLHDIRLSAAAMVVPESVVRGYITQARRDVPWSPNLAQCALIEEGYVVSFFLERTHSLGLSRHLVVGHKGALPIMAPAVAMLMREVGIGRAVLYWGQQMRGVGAAVHVIEPITVINRGDLGIPDDLLIAHDDILSPAPDELDWVEDEDAEPGG